jgi:DNA-directed RNA polymerase specialized sigma subunit
MKAHPRRQARNDLDSSTWIRHHANPKPLAPFAADGPPSVDSHGGGMTTKLDAEQVELVWKDYRQSQSTDSRNRLLENFLPLVRYNAERIWARLPDGVDLDDLISAGVFGLMDAIDAYDCERGVKFETYCVPRIRGAMLDELRGMDWVPRMRGTQ